MPGNPGADGTRERIVAAARELFHAQGYHATSLKQVAREADVHGGSLYHFFPSKESLVEAVLEEYLELLEPVLMEPARAATDDPVGRIERLLAGYRRHLLDTGFARGCPIASLALELSDTHPRARTLVQANLHAWTEAVADMLRAADPPPEVDLVALAAFVLTTMEGGVMLARASRSIEPYDASVAQLIVHLQRAIGSASGAADHR